MTVHGQRRLAASNVGPGEPSVNPAVRTRRKSLVPAARSRAKVLRGARGGQRAELELAHQRLRQLYEISKVLTRFGGVDATVTAIFGIVRQALALRSAIFILETTHAPQTIIWHDPDIQEGWLDSAKAHARTSYAYLSGTPSARYPELGEHVSDSPDRIDAAKPDRMLPILLPLAVERRPIFGALQIASARDLDEEDLGFINAVVNQLAIALDRHIVIESRSATERLRLDALSSQADAEAKQARAEREEERAQDSRLAAEQARTRVEAERDAAERKQTAAEALQERYEALVDNLDHAFVWEAHADTFKVRYVSARAEMVLGYPRRRWLEEDDFWMRCVHPADRQALALTFRRALADGIDQRHDHRCITAAGRVLWFHTGVHAVKGSPQPWLQGVSVDVTPNKEAEARIRAQLDFTQAVAQSIGEGVLAVDLYSRLTLFNPAAGRMLGCSEKQALGRPVGAVLQIVGSDGEPVTGNESPFDAAIIAGNASSRDDLSFAGKNGEPFTVSFTSSPLRQMGRISGAVVAFQDTTERMRTQLALRAAVERAQRATHDRDDLLALVSHDLKTPLSVILMTVNSIMKTFQDADHARVPEQLASIKRSAERMNRLIKNLLDTASIEAGKLSVELQSCTAPSLIGETLQSLLPLAASKSIRLESVLPPDLPRVLADAVRMDQVLSNLLGNAIKFTPNHGTITIRVRVVEDMLEFAVTDTGPGVPAHELPHLFDRYWQARRTACLGTGLGLSIVKGIVGAHGGRVWVESTVGEGSTFFFTLNVDLEPGLG